MTMQEKPLEGQKLKVCKKPCNECLFSKNKIVAEERAAEVITDCLTGDRWFVCHKTKNTCCAGFFQNHGRDVWPLRLAVLFELIDFIDHTEDKA